MTTVTLQEAQDTLPELLERADAGEEIIIVRGTKGAVRLIKIDSAHGEALPERWPGQLAHLGLNIPDSFFFDPLPEEELRRWEGYED